MRPDRAIDVIAECHARAVTIESGGKTCFGSAAEKNSRAARQRLQDLLAQLARIGGLFGQLLVVSSPGRIDDRR